MDFNSVFESISSQIASMSRDQIKEGILQFKGHFKLDFPEDYLDTLDDDKLRHILMAAFVTEARKQTV